MKYLGFFLQPIYGIKAYLLKILCQIMRSVNSFKFGKWNLIICFLNVYKVFIYFYESYINFYLLFHVLSLHVLCEHFCDILRPRII